MALNTAIRGLQIRDAFFGDGLKRNAGDGDIAELDLKTGGGLKIDTAQLAVEPSDFVGAGLVDNADNIDVNVDDSSIEVSSGNVVQVKALGITNAMLAGSIEEAKLDINTASGAGVDGYVLYWNNGAGKLDYKAIDVEAVLDTDIKYENWSDEIDETGYIGVHTLASTPVANSVQIFLNGLLQEEGTGKDYTIAGTTVTFVTAPETGDLILVHYIASA